MHGCCANDTLHMYYTNVHTSKEFFAGEHAQFFLKATASVKATDLKNSIHQQETIYGIKCRQAIFRMNTFLFQQEKYDFTDLRCQVKFMGGGKEQQSVSRKLFFFCIPGISATKLKIGPLSRENKFSCQLCFDY